MVSNISRFASVGPEHSRRGLNLEAFFRYLIGDNNFAHQSKDGTMLDSGGSPNAAAIRRYGVVANSIFVHQDMDAPLAHYYIFTGHNSYLTGNQLSSDCSSEPIKKALKKGVRVIELDLWPNTTKDDIDVCHGGTLTTPDKLGKCLKAIKEDAFSVSEYPVILTFEDHLHPYPHLQEKVAQMVKSIFQSMLFIPKSDMYEFPSPNKLLKKILISTKPPPKNSPSESDNYKVSQHLGNGLDTPIQLQIEIEEEDEDEDEDEDEVVKYRDLIAIHAAKHRGGMETFGSHGSSDKVGRLSMNEQALENAAAVIQHSQQLIRFTQRNMLRVYPKGARINSSNYDPLIAWMRGAQMVAFNMQGYDRYLWMMQGFFRANGGCGYVKKPDFLLSGDGTCDEVFNSMALPVKKTLKVKIYMGEGWRTDFHFRHFDYCSPPDFYVRMGVVGVPADTQKMRRTKTVNDQWIPIWNEEEELEFPIRVPELALLRIDVKDYDPSGEDEFAGQTCLPVSELRTGIRCVPLRNRRGDVYRSVRLLMRFHFN
ncbi:phospholipase C [Datura stramonium]|uniref:Phosphoinositide phospholipase C n=1 Tax=Datura stramonium TaxID=4076 RepID=A0ABS8WK04_DATST|nr:phospholipase C [Datura stramonium]